MFLNRKVNGYFITRIGTAVKKFLPEHPLGQRCINATLDNLWYNNLPVSLTGARYLTTLKILEHARQVFASIYSHFRLKKQACPKEIAPRDTAANPNPLQINSLRPPHFRGTRNSLCLQQFTAIFAPKNRPVPAKIGLWDTRRNT
jgi:hypothetical protein